MIKKIFIIGLIVWGGIIIYNKFIADIAEDFFNSNKGAIDIYQTSFDSEKAFEGK